MAPSDRDRSDETGPTDAEPLEDRLAELTDVLADLRSDLEADRRGSGRWFAPNGSIPGSDRQPPFRPPNPVELLRLTERYTIPTLIALLETTIRSLELLQASLRLADPDGELRPTGDRSMSGRRGSDRARTGDDRLADVRDGAAAGLTRSLSELRRALSESDLPRDATSREIIEDARDLTAEIEARLADAEARDRVGTSDRSGQDSATEPVSIDVTEPTQDADSDDEQDEDPDTPGVDVDAELESIKRNIESDAGSEATNEESEATDDGAKSNTDEDEQADDERQTDEDE